ncbi:hypothetical protein ACGF5M_03015 [Gemmatimonadota bacterium]
MDSDYAAWFFLYGILLILTVVLAAMKKTTWFSLIGVAIIPPYFLFVIWDAIAASGEQSEEEPEGQDNGESEGSTEAP